MRALNNYVLMNGMFALVNIYKCFNNALHNINNVLQSIPRHNAFNIIKLVLIIALYITNIVNNNGLPA